MQYNFFFTNLLLHNHSVSDPLFCLIRYNTECGCHGTVRLYRRKEDSLARYVQVIVWSGGVIITTLADYWMSLKNAYLIFKNF